MKKLLALALSLAVPFFASCAKPVGSLQENGTLTKAFSIQQLAKPASENAQVHAGESRDPLVVLRDGDGRYSAKVAPGRKIRIMQLTDIHFDFNGFGRPEEPRSFEVNQKTKGLISVEVARFRPDLIVITGDMVWTRFNPLGTDGYIRDAAKFFNALCAKNHCYWAYTLGNHEGGSFYSYFTDRENISKDLQQYRLDQPQGRLLYEYQIPGKQYGTFALEFQDKSNGLPLWECYLFYSGCGMLTSITPEQRHWLEDYYAGAKARDENRDVPGFAFFHIPLQQYDDGWKKSETHGWKYSGVAQEGQSNDVFASFAKTGVVATFAGHDHMNNYRTQWPTADRNIYLYYGRYSGYGAPDNALQPITNSHPNFHPGCLMMDVDLGDRQWTAWEWDPLLGGSDARSLDILEKIPS